MAATTVRSKAGMIGAAPPGKDQAETALKLPKHCPTCGESFPDDYAVCPRDTTPLMRAGVDDDPLIGQTLGDTYEVIRKLGEGGMGRVYEARHVRLGRSFAVKVLHPQYAGDRDSVARFRREATAVASVASPHVAQVVDVHTTRSGQPYIVMELLLGEDLGKVLEREGALGVSRAVSLARQVCRGLQAAHDASVVHRDLKPENVLLMRGRNGRELAKVVDFGIAKSVTGDQSLTQTGMVLGTPAYMAPEQARGSTKIDQRVDIYALGAMLYRSLTGRPAFSGENLTTTLTKVLNEEPPRPKSLRTDLPDALELIVQRAMAKNPDQRFSSMAELDIALAPFDLHETTTAFVGMPTPSSMARPPLEKNAFGHADTLAIPASHATRVRSEDGSRVRWARLRVLGYTSLLFFWTLVTVGLLTANSIGMITGEPLDSMGALLTGVVASVAPIAALVVWTRYLAQGAWRNSLTMIARAEVLAKLSLVSLGAFALVVSVWSVVEIVVLRSATTSRWMGLAAGLCSLVSGIVLGFVQYRSQKS